MDTDVTKQPTKTKPPEPCGFLIKCMDNCLRPCVRPKYHEDHHNPFSDTVYKDCGK